MTERLEPGWTPKYSVWSATIRKFDVVAADPSNLTEQVASTWTLTTHVERLNAAEEVMPEVKSTTCVATEGSAAA